MFCSEKCIEEHFKKNYLKCKSEKCEVYIEKSCTTYCNPCLERRGKIAKNPGTEDSLATTIKTVFSEEIKLECEYDPMSDF